MWARGDLIKGREKLLKKTMQKSIAIVLGLSVIVGAFLLASIALASDCTVTVTAPSSIQTAVDAAVADDVICLVGTFSGVSTVTVGNSNITIKSETGAVLDGGAGPAFRLADGLSHVTFEGLEIKNRTGSRGGGVEAWDRTTSHITVRDNYLHGNSYNGVLVGSEGGYVHSHWNVKGNTVEDNGFAGIELTNCSKCAIMENDIDGGVFGVVVQARNTVAGSGLTTIDGVRVMENTVDDTGATGIYVLSFTGHATNFSQISGASSLLERTNINENTVTDSGSDAIRFWAYNGEASAEKGSIMENEINCLSSKPGIRILESGSGPGDVEGVKVKNNTIDSDCSPDILDNQ